MEETQTRAEGCVRTAVCFTPSRCPAAAAYAQTAAGQLLMLWELHVALGHLEGGWGVCGVRDCLFMLWLVKGEC